MELLLQCSLGAAQLNPGYGFAFTQAIRTIEIQNSHPDVNYKNYNPVAIGLTPIFGLMPQSSRILSKLLPFLVRRLMQYSSR